MAEEKEENDESYPNNTGLDKYQLRQDGIVRDMDMEKFLRKFARAVEADRQKKEGEKSLPKDESK